MSPPVAVGERRKAVVGWTLDRDLLTRRNVERRFGVSRAAQLMRTTATSTPSPSAASATEAQQRAATSLRRMDGRGQGRINGDPLTATADRRCGAWPGDEPSLAVLFPPAEVAGLRRIADDGPRSTGTGC